MQSNINPHTSQKKVPYSACILVWITCNLFLPDAREVSLSPVSPTFSQNKAQYPFPTLAVVPQLIEWPTRSEEDISVLGPLSPLFWLGCPTTTVEYPVSQSHKSYLSIPKRQPTLTKLKIQQKSYYGAGLDVNIKINLGDILALWVDQYMLLF